MRQNEEASISLWSNEITSILNGSQIQIRKPVANPEIIKTMENYYSGKYQKKSSMMYRNLISRCPFGKPGDTLRVEEMLHYNYISDTRKIFSEKNLFLETPILLIEKVSFQKIMDITNEECLICGVHPLRTGMNIYQSNIQESTEKVQCWHSPKDAFCELWNDRYSKTLFKNLLFSDNPWCWVLNVKRIG